jgi:hypothetical protein
MADVMHRPESDPLRHTVALRNMLTNVATHARDDVEKIEEPKAQALFETTAEVCSGLVMALEHYEQGEEPAWAR